jgi:hypothetical protein
VIEGKGAQAGAAGRRLRNDSNGESDGEYGNRPRDTTDHETSLAPGFETQKGPSTRNRQDDTAPT